MTGADTTTRDGTPGWVKLLLVLSLAANVAVIGVILGHSIRADEEHRRGSERVIDWIIAMAPEDRRALAAARFDEARERIGDARVERADRLPAVVAAMRAEPFDPQALDTALDAMFDRSTSGRTIVRETMISLLEEFTPAERALFAEHFEERLSDRDERRSD